MMGAKREKKGDQPLFLCFLPSFSSFMCGCAHVFEAFHVNVETHVQVCLLLFPLFFFSVFFLQSSL
jgi:hypothetical protein